MFPSFILAGSQNKKLAANTDSVTITIQLQLQENGTLQGRVAMEACVMHG